MTTAYERTCSLVAAGDFLERLKEVNTMPDSKQISEVARRILRHFPSTGEIALLAEMQQKGEAIMPMLDPAAVPEEIRKSYRS